MLETGFVVTGRQAYRRKDENVSSGWLNTPFDMGGPYKSHFFSDRITGLTGFQYFLTLIIHILPSRKDAKLYDSES